MCPCVSVVPFIPTILRSLGPLALKNRAGLPSPRHLHKVHLSRQWFACMDIWLISLDTEFTNPMFSYFWGLLTPMLGFCWGLPHFWTYFEHVIHFKVLAQHGPNWQMAWQQSFISCICPSHNGAGICLKKDPLKLNSAIFTGKIRWFTMIDHVILHAKKTWFSSDFGGTPSTQKCWTKRHLGETKFSDRAEFSRTSSKALIAGMGEWWMMVFCFFLDPHKAIWMMVVVDDIFWMVIREVLFLFLFLVCTCSFVLLLRVFTSSESCPPLPSRLLLPLLLLLYIPLLLLLLPLLPSSPST